MHPNAQIAALVRQCSTKKELQAAGLKGERLATAWQWLQLRQRRLLARENLKMDQVHYGNSLTKYLTPAPLSKYESRRIKLEYRDCVQTWPMRYKFSWGYTARIRNRFMPHWPYHWQDKAYHVSLHYQHTGVAVSGSRSASSYDTYYVTLSYNVITHEAVVIGGLLTIRAKADAHLSEYPCIWLERNKTGPGLYAVQGRITGHDHHLCEDEVLLGKKEARLKNKLRRLRSTPPAGSPWVTRETSIAAGNCERGTDQFIRNVVDPYLKKQSGSYVPGLAMHISALLQLRRDFFTLRIAKHIKVGSQTCASHSSTAAMRGGSGETVTSLFK